MQALLYGYGNSVLECGAHALLSRAGFRVTVIVLSGKSRHCKGVDRTVRVTSFEELIATALAEASTGYDLVVACDDETLVHVLDSELSTQEKLVLLPVCTEKDFRHIGSKFGLATVLADKGVPSPPTQIVRDSNELRGALARIGGPVLLKKDRGGGGRGVKDLDACDPNAAEAAGLGFPLLVQKKMPGRLLDLSCFFSRGKPIFFSFAEILRSVPDSYGPSSVRRYLPGVQEDPQLIGTLSRLGDALGANGFCNITAIRDENSGELCIFEADLRPTVWIEYPKYFGEDPAIKMQRFFECREIFAFNRPDRVLDPVVLAFLPRLSLFEILFNRYDCRDHYENYNRHHIIATRLLAPFRSLSRALRAASVTQAVLKFSPGSWLRSR